MKQLLKSCHKIMGVLCIILLLELIFMMPEVGADTTGVENVQTEEILDSQKASLNIGEFIRQAEKYSKDVFGDTDLNEVLNGALKGEIDNSVLSKSILNLLGKELVGSVRTIGLIIIIIVIHAILKNISEGLENKSISKLTYYVQYILIVTLVMTNFADIISSCKEAIGNLVGFSNTLIPVLMTLTLSTGSIVSTNMIQPVLLFMITFISNFVNGVLIPILLIATSLGIVSKISDRVQIDKLSKFFKSSIIWILGLALTLFVSVLSVEGSLSSSVDGITAKTAKAAVSSFIPVVGKILGDAVDTVIGCTSILKNAVGIVGVIVILGICILPIIKLVIIMFTYYLGAAVCQPIADTKITNLLQQMGDTFKILLAIMCSISVLLVIGVTLVLKISNSGLMYR